MTRLERIQVIKLELLPRTGNPPSGSRRHPLILLCAAIKWSSTPMCKSPAGQRPRAHDSVLKSVQLIITMSGLGFNPHVHGYLLDVVPVVLH